MNRGWEKRAKEWRQRNGARARTVEGNRALIRRLLGSPLFLLTCPPAMSRDAPSPQPHRRLVRASGWPLGPFPLTPALSLRERENSRPCVDNRTAIDHSTGLSEGSLSLRERVRVRGKQTPFVPASHNFFGAKLNGGSWEAPCSSLRNRTSLDPARPRIPHSRTRKRPEKPPKKVCSRGEFRHTLPRNTTDI